MIETKSLRVGPAAEQNMIDTMACFGWELKSSQEINVKESHEELHGDTVYSVTTGENYVKLVFSRDTARPNYTRLKQLENTYFSILGREPAPMNMKIALLGLLVLIFPGVLYIVSKTKAKKAWEDEMATKGRSAIAEAKTLA